MWYLVWFLGVLLSSAVSIVSLSWLEFLGEHTSEDD